MQIRGMEISRIEELAELMTRQLADFDRRRDHRAAFLRVYTRMTQRVVDRMGGPFFADPAWIERVAIRFAAYYFAALDGFNGRGNCPPAWSRAFACAAGRRTFLLQDVLLGINAHINNDLPQVLADILRKENDWPQTERMLLRRFDHDQINRLLYELIPVVEEDVATHYGRLLRVLGTALGRLDELLATYGLKFYRDEVWKKTGFLLATPDPRVRQLVQQWIERDADRLADRIDRSLAPAWARFLVPLFRRLRFF